MAEVLAGLETYARLAGASIRSRAQDRLSFGLDFLATLVSSLSEFLAIVVIFSQLPVLGGWTLPEVAFLYGIATTSFALADMLIGHLDLFGETIRRGTFDVLLVRPHGSLFQVIASEFAIRRLGKVAQALSVLVYALATLQLEWSPARAAALPAALVCGAAIFMGIWTATGAISFWTTDIREVANSFTYGGGFLTTYPINLFGDWLRRFLAFVVPLAFVAYYPSLLILDKPDAAAGWPWLGYLTPAVAAVTLLAGRAAWNAGVRHYRSTGS